MKDGRYKVLDVCQQFRIIKDANMELIFEAKVKETVWTGEEDMTDYDTGSSKHKEEQAIEIKSLAEDPDEEEAELLFKSLRNTNIIQKYTAGAFGIELDQLENEQEYSKFQCLIPIDVDELRTTIPSTVDVKVRPTMVWKMMRNALGTDLTKFCLPVWINEPCNTLMKPAEQGFYLSETLNKAIQIEDPLRRLLLVAIGHMAVTN